MSDLVTLDFSMFETVGNDELKTVLIDALNTLEKPARARGSRRKLNVAFYEGIKIGLTSSIEIVEGAIEHNKKKQGG